MNEQPRVLVEVEDHIAVVTLNRPEKHNGLDKQMMDELMSAAKSIRKNRDIRAVVMTAKGDSFCAGLDFSFVAKNPGFIARYFLKRPWGRDNRFQRVANCWRDLPVPVIACVHGNCFGGGFQIILGCDFRIATPQAQLSIMEMKWGLIPDMSGTVNLSRLTRLDIAQELTMTGRIFTGVEGYQYGLISHLEEQPFERSMTLAREISSKSPDAIAATKYLFKKIWKKDSRGALLWERLTQLRLLGRKNQRIAMKNGLSKAANPQPFLNRSSFK
jgi:enoyl-CoA hydratase/carnithine racemase